MEKVIFDSDAATVWVDDEKKLIHHQCKKFMFGDSFRKLMLESADAFIKNDCTKWLSDDRANTSLKTEDRDWAFQMWGPKVLKAGWKHWAIVLPKKIFGELNMKYISQKYAEMGVEVAHFKELEEAYEWLKSK